MREYLLPKELVDKARAVVEANRKAGRTVAIAESCTGGLVCAALTEIPGSSEVLDAGYVTYSNEAKAADLHGGAGRRPYLFVDSRHRQVRQDRS